MNRRDFIIKSLKLSGALLLGRAIAPALFSDVLKNPIPTEKTIPKIHNILFSSNLPIVENHFDFTWLKPRQTTQKIVLHHSAIADTDSINADDIHHMHLDNGWSGIGYHLYIHKSGLIETGRPIEDIGAHTYKNNNNSIGICLAGNFEEELPTDSQMTSTIQLLSVLCQMYSLSPNESTLLAHRDLNETACPGENVYQKLPYLRESIGNII